jgi:hypothetical protein
LGFDLLILLDLPEMFSWPWLSYGEFIRKKSGPGEFLINFLVMAAFIPLACPSKWDSRLKGLKPRISNRKGSTRPRSKQSTVCRITAEIKK